MERRLEDYYNSPRLSQSKLKLLLSGVKAFTEVKEPELFFEEKQHFILGSAVDCLVTRGTQQFEQEFYISRLENKPSDTVKSIINEVFYKANITPEQIGLFAPNFIDYKDLILESCDSHNYQLNWKNETRVNKILENYEYWNELVESNGKIILTTEDESLINKIVLNFLQNDNTKYYFTNFAEEKEIINQLHIDFEIEGVECKALLDGVVVNTEDKTLEPFDVKTTGDKVFYFPKSMRRFGYYIQAAFYTEALKQWKERHKIYKDYTIKNFVFVVSSTLDPETPMVFKCTDNLLNIGKYGRNRIDYKINHSDSAIIKPYVAGYMDLIEAYKYYESVGFNQDAIANDIVDLDFDMDINLFNYF